MLHFFGILFFFAIAALLIIVGLAITLFSKLFGLGHGKTAFRHTRMESPADELNSQTTENNPRPKREKLFDKNDGEYVEFEEIKE